MQTGKLFIISGQSGVGKNAIADVLLEKMKLSKIITCTTRPARPDETEGKDYFFVSENTFKDRISKDYFLEYALVHNWHYGTPKDHVNNLLNNGQNILIVIDVQGAVQVKEKMPEAILIFIQYEEGKLESQMRKRFKNDDSRKDFSGAEILKRVDSAKKEAKYIKYYDYTVVNYENHPKMAVKEIAGIIQKETR